MAAESRPRRRTERSSRIRLVVRYSGGRATADPPFGGPGLGSEKGREQQVQRMRAARVSVGRARIELLASVTTPDLHGHQERLRFETSPSPLPREGNCMLVYRRVVRPVVHKGVLRIAKGEELGRQGQILRLLQASLGTWSVRHWGAIGILGAVTAGLRCTGHLHDA